MRSASNHTSRPRRRGSPVAVMAGALLLAPALATGWDPEVTPDLSAPGGCQRRREIAARLDVELSVGVRQVALDCLDRQEHRLRDLPIGPSGCGLLRDASLARRQRLDADRHQRPQTLARGRELLVGP